MSAKPVGPGNSQSRPADVPLGAAHAKLARMGMQVDVMQATLVRLLQEVVRAEARLGDTQAVQLAEANENLLLAVLASQQDPLTQLPNRDLLVDRFQQCRAQARRSGHAFALLFLDLDGFKRLNDTHGHAFGDEVLRWVAGRLTTAVREVDTVSRHGGDEFVVLLADLEQPSDVDNVVAKLHASLAGPVTLGGHEVVLSASIGVAHYPADGEDLDTLLGCADAEMFRSKHRADPPPDRMPGMSPEPKAESDADDARALAEAEARQARLREANEQLLLATLSARDLMEAAEFARQHQAEVLAAVTEELRNPTAPIRIVSAMLGREDDAAPLLPRVQKIIETQMRHMARLVADLVEASQRETHDLALERRPVEMTAVINAAIQVHRRQIDRRSQRLTVQLPAAPTEPTAPPEAAAAAATHTEVMGDASRLEQIVSNLLDNASRHTPEGGRISLSMTVNDSHLMVTVADDGVGITPQMLPYVFEPFLLDAQALGDDGPGLGIGLTVVRALVRAQGGELAAHSAGTHRGSQFIVRLPRADVPQEATDGR